MTAKQLLSYLLQLREDGNNLSEISVNFRENYDSEIIPLRHINEDLYDKETNSKLISICLLNREDDVEEDNEYNY
jgi:hypothetical protein